MTQQPQEDDVIKIAPGVLQDVHTMAREMIARGETWRLYPNDDRPMFTIAFERDRAATVIVQTNVDGIDVYIGRDIENASGASPTNG